MIRDLEEENFNFQNIDEFKFCVLNAIDNEGYFIDLGYVLHEEYTDNSKANYHCYNAVITCFNSCCNKTIPTLRSSYNRLNSIHVYNFFYTDTTGLGFFNINHVVLGYNALKAIRSLSE